MKFSKLSSHKGKFGKKRASNLNSRVKSRRSSSGPSVYKAEEYEREPATFAEKKADDLYRKYEKALKDRNKMLRGQYASDNPLDEIFAARKNMLDRRIDRMEQELDVLEKESNN